MSSPYDDSELKRLLDAIDDQDYQKIQQDDFDDFLYVGFDPMKVLLSILKKKKSNNITDKDFVSDINALVAVGLIKGNVNEHNIKKMAEAGQEAVKTLMTRYDVRYGGGKGQRSDYITIPRVVAAFPHVAVMIAQRIGGREYRGGPFSSHLLPNSMKVQVFPSVISDKIDEDVRNFLIAASLAYSLDQTIQISSIVKPDLKSLASAQHPYILLSYRSPVPKPEIRSKTIKAIDLASHYKIISQVVQTFREKTGELVPDISEDEFKKALSVA